jgi:hypothetical protein
MSLDSAAISCLRPGAPFENEVLEYPPGLAERRNRYSSTLPGSWNAETGTRVPSRARGTPKQVLEYPSRLILEPEQVLEYPSRLILEPEQVLEYPSRLIPEPEQVLEYPSRLIFKPNQVLEYPLEVVGFAW